MLAAVLAATLAWPLSRAELSNFTATSSYEDVTSFINQLSIKSPYINVTFSGKSYEGRPIPMVLVSNSKVTTQQQARKQKKLVIYIQGNIHAGEVEGKEAALHLLRQIAKNEKPQWLENAVLLINPIYNADGNEKWGPVAKNRPEQDGPDLVGIRANGQGFDLNRDCIKVDTPEMQNALENIYNLWDPDVVIDLHTTDGTRHGFDLTYSPPLNPNTNQEILNYSRENLLPKIRKESSELYNKDLFDYGNGSFGTSPRWSTFEPFGRYVTNYAGLRNSIGILSEATTFIPFKDRIIATERFVTSVLNNVCQDKNKIISIRKRYQLPNKLGVEFAMTQSRTEPVPIEKLEQGEQRPSTGRPKKIEMIKMEIFDRFEPTKYAEVPTAYIIPESESNTIELIRKHGIRYKTFTAGQLFAGTQFQITKFTQATQPFQGKKLIRLEGEFQKTTIKANSGDIWVPTNQPLGSLAFWILEPESPDGAVAWGFLGDKLSGIYPIKKVNK